SEVRNVQGSFLSHNTSFLSLGLALMALYQVDTTHNCAVFLRKNLNYFAGTTFVLTSQYDNLVAFTDLLHRHSSLQYFWSQGDDLHVVLAAKFARNRSEDTCADRLFLVIDKNSCVIIEADD